MRRIAVLDAPSNLGLRPPTETSVPGCAKAPGALRDHGLITKLGARDAGCLTPPRYDPGDWRPGDGVAHAPQIAAYSRALADRIGAILDAGEFPVILGGDCSILLGSGVAMHRLGEAVGGRIGLVFVDGHSDFRHPGNASYVGAAAGEDLALVTGRGQADLAAIESRRPYFRDVDVVVLGIRAQDEYRLDLQAAGIVTRPVPALRAEGAARSAQWARDQLVDCAGYWVHVDVDVLDPAVMPAVDAPSPGGIAFPELEILLSGLVESPHCLGVEITVFDPDYDPDGQYAAEITAAVVAGLEAAHTVTTRPDLIAARADIESTPPAGRGLLAPRATPEDTDLEHRRAAAAAQSVSLAASGMSSGVSSGISSEEPAIPAVTALAVEDSDETPPLPRDPDQEIPDEDEDASPSSSDPDPEPVEPANPEPTDQLAAHDVDVRAGRAAEPAAARFAGTVLDIGARNAEPADDAGAEARTPEPDTGEARITQPDAEVAEPAAEVAEPDADGAATGVAPDAAEDLEQAEPQDATPEDAQPEDAQPNETEPEDAHPDKAEPVAARLVPRPLGQAPLLDSEPLPATRPGMLRPRVSEEPAPDNFSLPAQRPAFEIGLGPGQSKPADIA
ncbi:hypothetical protein Ade02nite_62550 [Paractinoplanes deccanensis]|uniref:Arginase n=1 Tax=Paractinoplanes deccanensis TaxID=113561 RepID=A0ABQ3YCA0_9ACTN|nr:hypothetical protein Ade02nite_62550 [Actinoplanes deccanensis]